MNSTTRSIFTRQPGHSFLTTEQIQGHLLLLAALILLCAGAMLTLSPVARSRTWQVAYRWEHWVGMAGWLVMAASAHFISNRRLPDHDPYLLPAAFLLSGWGLVAIWRVEPYFGLRQSIWLVISSAALIAGLYLPDNLSFLRRYKYLWLSGGLALTALTLIFGANPMGVGARMWLGCCGLYFQPSEPLKLLLIVYLAAYLGGYKTQAGLRLPTGYSSQARIKTAEPLLPLLSPSILMTGLALGILLAQRDLGTASIFLFIYTVIVYLATGNRYIILMSGLTMIAAGISGYILFDVVRLRIDAWLNPWADPSGRSYQIVQSLLSAANGGLIGRGFGMGSPGLVPVAQSDFIYTAIVEESGLVGAVGLLLIYALLAARGLRIALTAPDAFRRTLAAGITAHIVAQSILITGGNLRLLPLTGVTLPFVSYGGSSLLTSFLSLLILLKISAPDPEVVTAEPANPQGILQLAGLLFLGLLSVSLATGWWSVYRGPDLLTRTDNPRRALADRDVPRGAILDRNNKPIAITAGSPGSYTRDLRQPALSPIIGYNSAAYGQAGVEAAYDDYLRGLKGIGGMELWISHILYGQPPAGLDIRLSLDLRLQEIADQSLTGHKGALTLLNAQTGEILAMASHPGYSANTLAQDWGNLIQDPNAPLLNRAIQGSYPADGLAEGIFSDIPPDQLRTTPNLGWQQVSPAGMPGLSLSPLQAALTAAALSHGGERPAAILVSAVQTPKAGWVILAAQDTALQLLAEPTAVALTEEYTPGEAVYWQFSTEQSADLESMGVWYVSGTNLHWNGIPFAIAIYLEENDPQIAAAIGQHILAAAMFP